MRLALLISYDGTPYRGWGDVRDRSLRPVLRRLCGTDVVVHAASRTDAGVHARGQVCVFDYADRRERDLSQLLYSMNQLLPEDLSVRELVAVPDAFDPRTNLGKEYIYRISTSDTRDPLHRLYEWHAPKRRDWPAWDIQAARDAAALLQSATPSDFSAFANTPRGAERHRLIDPFCTMHELLVCETGPGSVRITLRADRFLYKMARNLVGSLVRVGYRELELDALKLAMASGKFQHTGSPGWTAPASGLVLDRVFYGEADPFVRHGTARHDSDIKQC